MLKKNQFIEPTPEEIKQSPTFQDALDKRVDDLFSFILKPERNIQNIKENNETLSKFIGEALIDYDTDQVGNVNDSAVQLMGAIDWDRLIKDQDYAVFVAEKAQEIQAHLFFAAKAHFAESEVQQAIENWRDNADYQQGAA